ncbi:MAG: hypothetical protein V1862_11425, partial [Methanobacteriota archaeon]
MQRKPLRSYWVILILLLICCIAIPVLTIADDTMSSASQTGDQVGIYDGSIPSGEGIVSIKATSGKLYQVPAMSPLGVIQALAGTDIIDSYKVGDELIVKMGLLTLDGINGYSNSGDNSWFVLVNDKKLQDYLLPKENALNTFKLINGDAILFAYGNPTKPTEEALRTLKITIGAQSGSASSITSNAGIPITSIPTVVSTTNPTAEPTITEKLVETSDKNEIDLNQPVFEGEDTKETVASEPTSTPSEKKPVDPNQPVFEGEDTKETVASEPTSTPSEQKSVDPNQPVIEDQVLGDTVTPEPTTAPEETNIESTEKTSPDNKESDTKQVKNSSGQDVIYTGTLSLPSGNVNLTAESGMEYNDVPANTPLGLLQALLSDGK